MLVLSRMKDEKIILQVEGLDEPIELTVVRIDRKKVRLGINASAQVKILRKELEDKLKIKQANPLPNSLL